MNKDNKDVYLNISDVASYIGQNKWDFTTPFTRLWKRVDKEVYEKCLLEFNNDIVKEKEDLKVLNDQIYDLEVKLQNKELTKRQFTLQSKSFLQEQQRVEEVISKKEERYDKIHLRPNQIVEKHLDAENIKIIQTGTASAVEKQKILKEVLEERGLQKLQGDVNSYINRSHGTRLEDSAIKMFERKMNVELDVTQKFNKKLLRSDSTTTKYNWYVCGKVDGLHISYSNYADSYIVEVKNRTRAFFSSLRDYEKTQIQLYMWMLGIPHAKLVEKYDNKIRITDVVYDVEYINEIISDLLYFTELFENNFIDSDFENKLKFVNMNDKLKQNFLYNLYLTKIMERKIINNESDEDDYNCLIDDDL